MTQIALFLAILLVAVLIIGVVLGGAIIFFNRNIAVNRLLRVTQRKVNQSNNRIPGRSEKNCRTGKSRCGKSQGDRRRRVQGTPSGITAAGEPAAFQNRKPGA
jgi:hypothetical protein